jgi:hypothetical protein
MSPLRYSNPPQAAEKDDTSCTKLVSYPLTRNADKDITKMLIYLCDALNIDRSVAAKELDLDSFESFIRTIVRENLVLFGSFQWHRATEVGN